MSQLDIELAPDDDAFIRTAIRGLRPPEHHPAFWGELEGELDTVDGALAAEGRRAAPAERAGPQPPAEPIVVQLPEAPPDPAPEPTERRNRRSTWPLRTPPTRRAASRSGPAPPPTPLRRGPSGSGPSGPVWPRARAPGPPARSGSAGTRPKLVVHHDPAILPESLRRTSNAILLAVATLAAVVALLAGLTLVRQRSDAGGVPPTEQPSQPAAAAPEVRPRVPVDPRPVRPEHPARPENPEMTAILAPRSRLH